LSTSLLNICVVQAPPWRSKTGQNPCEGEESRERTPTSCTRVSTCTRV